LIEQETIGSTPGDTWIALACVKLHLVAIQISAAAAFRLQRRIAAARVEASKEKSPAGTSRSRPGPRKLAGTS